jgi:hypothetical protein
MGPTPCLHSFCRGRRRPVCCQDCCGSLRAGFRQRGKARIVARGRQSALVFQRSFACELKTRAGRQKLPRGISVFPGFLLVDLVGIEPTTSSMPWKRAPSCATGPHEKRCTRRLKQFNSRLLAIDSQTLWRLLASLSARQILGVAQFGHADHTMVILKDFGRAQPPWLTRGGCIYPVRARSFASAG